MSSTLTFGRVNVEKISEKRNEARDKAAYREPFIAAGLR